MVEFLWTGTIVGAVLGLLHMLLTLSTRLGQPGLNPLKTLWHGIWTLVLWTLFGAYVFFRAGITPEGRWLFFVAGD